jgi:hypothetical protein
MPRGRGLGIVVTDLDADTGGSDGGAEPDAAGAVQDGVGDEFAGQQDGGVAQSEVKTLRGTKVTDYSPGLPDRRWVCGQCVLHGLVYAGPVPNGVSGTPTRALRFELA